MAESYAAMRCGVAVFGHVGGGLLVALFAPARPRLEVVVGYSADQMVRRGNESGIDGISPG